MPTCVSYTPKWKQTSVGMCPAPFFVKSQRKIGKQLRKIDESPEDGRGADSVSGQVRFWVVWRRFTAVTRTYIQLEYGRGNERNDIYLYQDRLWELW